MNNSVCVNLLTWSTLSEAGFEVGLETHDFVLVKCAKKPLQTNMVFLLENRSASLTELRLICSLEMCYDG